MENDARHLESYFYSDFPYEGKFDLPVIKRQQVFLDNLKLIRYSSTVAHEYDEADATVHFFEYDDRFGEVWRKPSSYIARLSQYRQVIAPDFSMYTNMALALQVFNTYRNRWLGAFWQSKGLTVIPSVS
ncbi:MAG: DUF4417 domain-containing protein, partial [Coriobacteriales bacterium]|nr:DUF4417 domain-containing protein [Coriobacteriales bacterium]